MNRQEKTNQWYENYYEKKGANRNDLRTNPEVLFQTLALEASVVRALAVLDGDPKRARVLDVGCGTGGKNITTENISARNMLNIQRVCRRKPNQLWFSFDRSKYLDESLNADAIMKEYYKNH